MSYISLMFTFLTPCCGLLCFVIKLKYNIFNKNIGIKLDYTDINRDFQEQECDTHQAHISVSFRKCAFIPSKVNICAKC